MTELANRPSKYMVNCLYEYAEAARGAFAANTNRARKFDSQLFADWCHRHSSNPLPAADTTIVEFIDDQAKSKALATIRRYVSTIATMHDAARVNPNPARSERVRLALKRVARAKGNRQQQAAGLNWRAIEYAIHQMVDSPRAILDSALVCVGFDTMCRRSELVALKVDKLQHHGDGSGTILVHKSKTDQQGKGRIAYLSPTTMQHLARWLAFAKLKTGPLFRSMDRHGNINSNALSTMGVNRAFKRIADLAGHDAKTVSGHSCRVGAAQDMTAADVELSAIMQAGGWKSPAMPARYSERLQARRSGMAKLAAIQNR